MRDSRLLGFLGLAMRAGQVVSGGDMVEREVRAGRTALVLVDSETSARTRDKLDRLCKGRGIALHALDPGLLGQAIGKDNRMVAAIRKGPLANQLATLLDKAAKP